MKILLANRNYSESMELTEYLQDLTHQVVLVDNRYSLCTYLSEFTVDLLLYNVSCIEDFATIKYVNEHYPTIRVLISTENGLGTTIENVRNTVFSSIRKPFHLGELGAYLGSCTSETLL